MIIESVEEVRGWSYTFKKLYLSPFDSTDYKVCACVCVCVWMQVYSCGENLAVMLPSVLLARYRGVRETSDQKPFGFWVSILPELA
jgi:hypothetical protein